MNFERVFNTIGCFMMGSAFLAQAVSDMGVFAEQNQESRFTLLKVGAILLPVAVLIERGIRKIFDDLGWQSSPTRELTVWCFTFICSVALVSAAAIGFGMTKSWDTSLVVCKIGIYILIGSVNIIFGMENIFIGSNQLPIMTR